jgi:UDP-glucuronate decarboxylase
MAVSDGRVISNFIVQALTGSDITIYGDGSQTRSFCYVDDLVEGIVRTFEYEKPIDLPINLGNPNEFTMLELANKIIELCKSSSDITFRPLPSDDPRQRKPDISRAEQLLDWYPLVGLEQGLIKTIAYFQKALKV